MLNNRLARSQLCISTGCFTLRYTNHKEIGIFKLPSRSGDFYKQWKNYFLSVLCKFREADDNLKKKISPGDIYFCERHFVKLIASAHQPAFMSGCLTINHTCFPCLPRWEGGEFGKVGEQCTGKMGKVYEWSEVVRWERWENSDVAQSERWEGSEEAIWERWGIVRWQGGRFPVLFNSGRRRVRPRFHLFVSDANQRNEGA